MPRAVPVWFTDVDLQMLQAYAKARRLKRSAAIRQLVSLGAKAAMDGLDVSRQLGVLESGVRDLVHEIAELRAEANAQIKIFGETLLVARALLVKIDPEKYDELPAKVEIYLRNRTKASGAPSPERSTGVAA